jgi:hypothetical protein
MRTNADGREAIVVDVEGEKVTEGRDFKISRRQAENCSLIAHLYYSRVVNTLN